jgi:predicted nucleic acid-binding protein
VKVIVDANIVFSGILNVKSRIGDLLINSKSHFDFIAPDFLRIEIYRHYPRLQKISGLSFEEVRESESQVCKDISFISEEQIQTSSWAFAEKLVADIDPKDTPYVAYSKQFRCKIWSGDKKLVEGLRKKGFNKFISIEDLYLLRDKP